MTGSACDIYKYSRIPDVLIIPSGRSDRNDYPSTREKKYYFPSNFVCYYFGGRLFIKTLSGMNLFKSRASLEYLCSSNIY